MHSCSGDLFIYCNDLLNASSRAAARNVLKGMLHLTPFLGIKSSSLLLAAVNEFHVCPSIDRILNAELVMKCAVLKIKESIVNIMHNSHHVQYDRYFLEQAQYLAEIPHTNLSWTCEACERVILAQDGREWNLPRTSCLGMAERYHLSMRSVAQRCGKWPVAVTDGTALYFAFFWHLHFVTILYKIVCSLPIQRGIFDHCIER